MHSKKIKTKIVSQAKYIGSPRDDQEYKTKNNKTSSRSETFSPKGTCISPKTHILIYLDEEALVNFSLAKVYLVDGNNDTPPHRRLSLLVMVLHHIVGQQQHLARMG